ncbi:hypothetical protein TNCV_3558531 [Trichonephila clavipes]|uniref:Uncharacterized protein n=1 Tax=Trichonephila clavipes TaxID=2585209 RepID=A0A8X6WCJ0_TRICX|nr:hypothetical protein TNCV_3558531 [Trichonephila clavipes]
MVKVPLVAFSNALPDPETRSLSTLLIAFSNYHQRNSWDFFQRNIKSSFLNFDLLVQTRLFLLRNDIFLEFGLEINISGEGPDFWGLLNLEWSLCSKGRRQSPVDIDPNTLLFDPSLRNIQVDKIRTFRYACAPLAGLSRPPKRGVPHSLRNTGSISLSFTQARTVMWVIEEKEKEQQLLHFTVVYEPQCSRRFLPGLEWVQLFVDQHHVGDVE